MILSAGCGCQIGIHAELNRNKILIGEMMITLNRTHNYILRHS